MEFAIAILIFAGVLLVALIFNRLERRKRGRRICMHTRATIRRSVRHGMCIADWHCLDCGMRNRRGVHADPERWMKDGSEGPQ